MTRISVCKQARANQFFDLEAEFDEDTMLNANELKNAESVNRTLRDASVLPCCDSNGISTIHFFDALRKMKLSYERLCACSPQSSL